MKQFAFRLATMLKLCVTQRDQQRQALAKALAAFQDVQRRIDVLDGELQGLLHGQHKRRGPVDVVQLQAVERYAAALRVDRAHCATEQTELAAQVADRRASLLAADREVRTLEKLREKQLHAFQAEDRKLLQRELDEIAARDWWRAGHRKPAG